MNESSRTLLLETIIISIQSALYTVECNDVYVIDGIKYINSLTVGRDAYVAI